VNHFVRVEGVREAQKSCRDIPVPYRIIDKDAPLFLFDERIRPARRKSGVF
jgi:hypothetical protein